MICAYCGDGFVERKPYICVEWNDPQARRHGGPRSAGVGELLYHAQCFSEMAGGEYTEALHESYYSGKPCESPNVVRVRRNKMLKLETKRFF